MKFCWSTINVKDLEESLTFYEDIVGLKLENRFPAGPGMEIAFLGDGETKIELIYTKNRENINIGKDISWGFQVESLDEILKILSENEISIYEGPFQPNPHTKFVYVLDPNELKIQFVEISK